MAYINGKTAGLYYNGRALRYPPQVTLSTGGSDEPGTPTSYTITNNLTNCTTSNSATSVQEGSSYNATLTANAGYTFGYRLNSIVVTMGGAPVSIDGNSIHIESVTGNIVITATADAVLPDDDDEKQYKITYRVFDPSNNMTDTSETVTGGQYTVTVTPTSSGRKIGHIEVIMGVTLLYSADFQDSVTYTIDDITDDVYIVVQEIEASGGGETVSGQLITADGLYFMTADNKEFITKESANV